MAGDLTFFNWTKKYFGGMQRKQIMGEEKGLKSRTLRFSTFECCHLRPFGSYDRQKLPPVFQTSMILVVFVKHHPDSSLLLYHEGLFLRFWPVLVVLFTPAFIGCSSWRSWCHPLISERLLPDLVLLNLCFRSLKCWSSLTLSVSLSSRSPLIFTSFCSSLCISPALE